eukprot:m.1046587 g.1046587  ORF g.1046587 m.1046587 type:complete len:71 (-) comp24170_c0_seq130:1500-1712(-)
MLTDTVRINVHPVVLFYITVDQISIISTTYDCAFESVKTSAHTIKHTAHEHCNSLLPTRWHGSRYLRVGH